MVFYNKLSLLIMICQMLAVNFISADMCSKRKRPLSAIIILFTAFTLLLFGVIILLDSTNLPFLAFDGGGIYLLLGFLFIFLMPLGYENTIRHNLMAVSTTWVYTLSAYVFGIQVSKMCPQNYVYVYALIAQTLFYILTIPFYLRTARKHYLSLLATLSDKQQNYFVYAGLMWFGFLFIANYSSVRPYKFSALILTILAIGNLCMTYYFIYGVLAYKNVHTN